jgi:23S rRNA pseudouridine1911/1915/1917 synthase
MPATVIEIGRRDHGQTVAAVLKARLGLSWSRAKRLVEGHQVRYAGQVIGDPAHRVRAGRKITVAAGAYEARGDEPRAGSAEPKARSEKPKTPAQPKRKPDPGPASDRSPLPAPGSPIEILYSDDAIVVVDKPAGLTTVRHATEAAEFGDRGKHYLPKTLADLLPGMLGEPGRQVIAVHRIDRDTSGVVVFARTPAAAKGLTAQFRKHTADRRYLALVRGRPKSGRIESQFVRDRGDGRRGSGTEGKRAVTHVAILERFDEFALVECRLETGRTHQVRIHLGEAGTPLCGEKVYDRPVNGKPVPDGSGATRPMLQAARLGIDHPETGERMTWESPPPADFEALLDRSRKGERPA